MVNSVSAYIDSSSVTASHNLVIDADNLSVLGAVAVGGRFAKFAAVGGSISVNTIANTTKAYIAGAHADSSHSIQADSIFVTADDMSVNSSFTGAVSGALWAAVGGAFSVSTVANRVNAYVDSSTLVADDSLSVSATNAAIVGNIVISAQAAVGGVGGSVAVNTIANLTSAYISNSDVQANDVLVYAADNSVNGVVTGSLQGGVGAVGVAISVNTLDVEVKSYVSNSTLVVANLVDVKVDNNTVIGNVAASVQAGIGAVGGSVAVNTLVSDAYAYIAGASTIEADKVAVSAWDASTIAALSGSVQIGAAAQGVAVSVNTTAKKLKAYIDSSTVQADHSVKVDAHNNASIYNIAVSGQLAAASSQGASVAVNSINNVTDAAISNSQIDVLLSETDEEGVFVLAKDETVIKVVAGSVQGSIAQSFGIAVPVNTIANTVNAYIDRTTMGSVNTVSVTAENVPTIEVVSVSGQLGLTAIGGSFAVNTIVNTTRAYIANNTDIFAQGDILVSAKDNATIKAFAGSFQGGALSFGAAVSVNTISNSVLGYIDNSVITSSKMVEVKAENAPTINSIVVSGQGGLIAAGGSVSVDTIVNTTKAYIVNSDDVSAQEGVSIISLDTTSVEVFAGSLQGGVKSFGAAVSITSITNSVLGYIDNSDITSSKKLEVKAENAPTINSIVVSGQGGLIAAGGSVSVNTIVNTTKAYITNNSSIEVENEISVLAKDETAIDSTAGSVQVGIGAFGAAVSTNTITNRVSAYIDDSRLISNDVIQIEAINSPTIENLSISGQGAIVAAGASVAINTITNTTKAYITNTSSIEAKNEFSVLAKDETTIDSSAGSVQLGLVSFGAAVSTNTVKNRVDAYVDDASLETDGLIKIEARETINVDNLTISGQGGAIIAAGASVVDNTIDNHLQAYLGEDAVIHKADLLHINADSTQTLDASSGIVTAGIVAAGASVARTESAGSVKAYVADNTEIGNSQIGDNVKNMTLTATGNTDALAKAIAGSAGVVSANGADARTIVRPTVEAYLGDQVVVDINGDLNIKALSKIHANADAVGTSVGGISVGFSNAMAKASPTVTAKIGNQSDIHTGNNLNLSAEFNTAPFINVAAKAQSLGSAGSLLVGILAGADAKTETNVTVTTTVGNATKLDSGNDMTISSEAVNKSDAKATGNAKGLFSDGGGASGTKANSMATTLVTTNIEPIANLQAVHDITISSEATTIVTGFTSGASGQNISGAFENLLSSGIQGFFTGEGIPSVLSSGGTLTRATIENTAVTNIKQNANLKAGNRINITALAETRVDGDAVMSAKAVINADGISVVDVAIDSDAIVNFYDGARAKANDVTISAVNHIQSDLDADTAVTAEGFNAVSSAVTRVNVGTATDASDATISLGTNVKLIADGALSLEALNQKKPGDQIKSHPVSTAFGGAISTSSSLAEASVYADSTIITAESSEITGGSIVIHSESSYDVHRDPDSSADTVVSTLVTKSREVVRAITTWLPWPLDKLVEWITDTIFYVVEVFDFSDTEEKVGGKGWVSADTINLNGKIFSSGASNRYLKINADGTIDPLSNISATVVGDEIIVDDISNNGNADISFLVPNGNLLGNAVLYIDIIAPEIRIENYSDMNLVLQKIDTNAEGQQEPDLTFVSQNIHEYQIADQLVQTQVYIENYGLSDIVFTQIVSSVTAQFHFTNIQGGIQIRPAANGSNNVAIFTNAINNENQIYIEVGDVGDIDLQARNGDIGSSQMPFSVRLVRGKIMPDGSVATMPVVLNAHAAGNIFLDVVGVNTTFSEPDPADIVDGIELNLQSDSGDIYLNTGKGILVDEQLVETIEIAGNMIDVFENISREAHAIYDLRSIIADQGDVHINIIGDANIGQINTAISKVFIDTTGSLYDLDESSADTNIAAVDISLSVPDGSIGKENAPLTIDSSTAAAGLLLAAAGNNIFINESSGDLIISQVISAAGQVMLTADGSILAAQAGANIKVKGTHVTLSSNSGTLGQAGNPLVIDSDLLTGAALQDVYLVEIAGDLNLDYLSAASGSIDLSVPTGALLDVDDNVALLGQSAILNVEQSVGASSNPLDTQLAMIDTINAGGGVWLNNHGALSIGNMAGNGGIHAGGAVEITTNSPLTVTDDIISNSDITLTATDSIGNEDHIHVSQNAIIQSSNGGISLLAGDDLTIDQGSLVKASGAVILIGDYGNADPGIGSTIKISGRIAGDSVVVMAGPDNDEFIIDHNDPIDLPIDDDSNQITLDGTNGSDTYNIFLAGVNRDLSQAEIIVNVSDSGDTGTDNLNVHGQNDDENPDIFLLRENFLALLRLDNNENIITSERINYNDNINGVFTINAYDGDDVFAFDDNSAVT